MQNKSAVDIEREQEALLVKKYGGLNPLMKRKQPLMPKEHKYFDSADWALAKEGKGGQGGSAELSELQPRKPTATITAQRGASKLDASQPS
ncbi:hypothetical protein MNEG_4934 [Monoraphidium neglectum]|uniref:Negatively light-regulated protein n=1 Tax=Monoraphidium neglectum TaxID=145388 RepID=A0A0D2JWC8_9CHLO|nr:hypothetical protein MNEG_4934 [Monoraphidium neglectum]KIZ03023.1 hypothetical protein MNEG_4934 [Monoraphidium neglectum]|eukprot:XP_013902042.1 hypothetical protein MNEG_4934 [Monoraphidium neglectum]